MTSAFSIDHPSYNVPQNYDTTIADELKGYLFSNTEPNDDDERASHALSNYELYKLLAAEERLKGDDRYHNLRPDPLNMYSLLGEQRMPTREYDNNLDDMTDANFYDEPIAMPSATSYNPFRRYYSPSSDRKKRSTGDVGAASSVNKR